MGNIAVSYSKLGMHEEALGINEEVLKFYRRVLPENHPDIGEGRVGSDVCTRLVDCEGTGFSYCDVQARPWAILLRHTPTSGCTRKRSR